VIQPLRLTFDLGCSPEHAFRTWTARIDAWWPADHTASGHPDAKVILEPRLGGRIYERTRDGAEHDWGEITLWRPPDQLGYLWHLRRDPADATEVLIRFSGHAGGTRVEIEHSGWERLGAEGPEWRSRNQDGWTSLLPHFQAAASGEEDVL
jgi:uncharacterized protein YndB with AHSA1/START domain